MSMSIIACHRTEQPTRRRWLVKISQGSVTTNFRWDGSTSFLNATVNKIIKICLQYHESRHQVAPYRLDNIGLTRKYTRKPNCKPEKWNESSLSRISHGKMLRRLRRKVNTYYQLLFKCDPELIAWNARHQQLPGPIYALHIIWT